MGIRRVLGVSALAVAATAIVAAAPAAAATSEYAPDADSRTFANSIGGWTANTETDPPVCVPPVTCPDVTNGWRDGGGASGAGDGYLRTTVGGLASVPNTVTVTWQSPTFLYNGADGVDPTSLVFGLARRSDAGELLALLDEGAHYGVFIDRISDGSVITVIDNAELTDAGQWIAVAPVALPASALVRGEDYQIRIVTTLELPVSVIPESHFDWDDVILQASTNPAPPPPGGVGGDGVPNGYNVDLPDRDDKLRPADLRNTLVNATLRGDRLEVKVRCPNKAEKPCKFKFVGRLKGKTSPKVTSKGKAKVKPARNTIIEFKVKKKYLAKVEKRERMTFTGVVRSGKVKRKFVRNLRLRHAQA